jgi:hypothetical protein
VVSVLARTRRILALDPWGACLLAGLLAVLLVPPLVPYEPAWEIAANLGYAACAALVTVFRLVPMPGMTVRSCGFAMHRTAGDAALALAAGHVAVMLLADPFMLDYLGWMMPLHVMAGVLAAAALLLAVASREPGLRLMRRLGGPHLHAWSGLAAGGLAAIHVLTASSKLTAFWRQALLAGFFLALLAPAAVSLARRTRQWPDSRKERRFSSRVPPPQLLEPAGTADIIGLLAALGILAALLAAVPNLVRRLAG